MSILNDFYTYTKNNDILLIPYKVGFYDALTMRENNKYAIFVDFTALDTIAQIEEVVAHEQGHVATGALHKVDSPYELVGKNEFKADKWAITTYLPYDKIKKAIHNGYTEVWQLADYFNVSFNFMQKAIAYYKENKGYKFS